METPQHWVSSPGKKTPGKKIKENGEQTSGRRGHVQEAAAEEGPEPGREPRALEAPREPPGVGAGNAVQCYRRASHKGRTCLWFENSNIFSLIKQNRRQNSKII